MRNSAIAGAAMILALVSCSEPVLSTPRDIVGSWISREPLQPRGSMDRILTFGRDGTFAFRVDSYGVYSSSRKLSSYSEIVGRYTADEDRLQLEPISVTTWDSFYGDAQPIIAAHSGSLLDDATFQIRGNELTLTYLSYPADAPVVTTMRFRRR